MCCIPRAADTCIFKFWSLDAHLQNAELFRSISSILSRHIHDHVFEMPSLQQCLDALSDLRTQAALPLAVVGKRANSDGHAPFPAQRDLRLQVYSFEPMILSRASALQAQLLHRRVRKSETPFTKSGK